MVVTAKAVHNLADKIRELREILEKMRDKKREVLDNAEGADYPNEERVEGLQTQISILEDAVDNMDNIIGDLEEYE